MSNLHRQEYNVSKRNSDTWLDEDEFLCFTPSAIGGQNNVNHVGCPAGTDRKRRLYIKRTAKGVVAFCHHCGKKGASIDTDLAKSWGRLDDTNPVGKRAFQQGTAYAARAWINARLLDQPGSKVAALSAWLGKKRIPESIASTVSNPILPRVGLEDADGLYDIFYLPIVGDLPSGAELCGIQTRNFNTKCKGPKYKTDIWLKAPPWVYRRHGDSLDTVAVVEDWASAVYLAANGLPAVPLYGNTCNDETLLHLAKNKGVKNLVVWLDNDKPEIVEEAKRIRKRAAIVFNVATRIAEFIPAPTDLKDMGKFVPKLLGTFK